MRAKNGEHFSDMLLADYHSWDHFFGPKLLYCKITLWVKSGALIKLLFIGNVETGSVAYKKINNRCALDEATQIQIVWTFTVELSLQIVARQLWMSHKTVSRALKLNKFHLLKGKFFKTFLTTISTEGLNCVKQWQIL